MIGKSAKKELRSYGLVMKNLKEFLQKDIMIAVTDKENFFQVSS